MDSPDAGQVEPASTPRGDGLGRVAARGALVTLSGQGSRILLQMATVVVLARLLSPDDYGLMAMAMVIVGVGEIFRDFGLSTAAVQAPNLSTAERDNLFWASSGIGALLALAIVALAPLFALLFGQGELTAMAQVLSLTFLLNGFAAQYRAGLNRELRFGALILADITAQVLGLTAAIVAAGLGAGRWALVVQQVLQFGTALVMVALLAGWLPGRYRRGVSIRPFLRYGWNLVGAQVVGYLGNNVDTFVIGTRFGPAPLGLYNRAYQLLMSPLGQLRGPTTTVALPVLSRLHDDPDRASDFIRRGQLALGYTMIAGLGVAVGAADPLVSLMLGSEWSAVAPILVFLGIAGIADTLMFVGYWVYLARGLTDQLLRFSLVTLPIKIVCIAVGSIWGVTGVAAGFMAAPVLCWPISLWWLSRITPLPTRDLATGAIRIMGLALTAAAAGYGAAVLLSGAGDVVAILAAAVAGASVYLLAGLVLRPVRRDLRDVWAIGRMVAKR